MKNLKVGVLAFGILGVIACFLPMVSFGDQSFSLWSLRGLGAAGQVYLTMAGYVAAVVAGALAMAKPPMQRWQAVVALIGFALVLVKIRDGLFKGAIGGMLMSVAAVGGVIVAILCLVKPEKA